MDFLNNSILNNKFFNTIHGGAGKGNFNAKEILKKISIFIVFILLIIEIAEPLSKASDKLKQGTPMGLLIGASMSGAVMIGMLGYSMVRPMIGLTIGIVIFGLLFYSLMLTTLIYSKLDLSKTAQGYLYSKFVFYFFLLALLLISLDYKAKKEQAYD